MLEALLDRLRGGPASRYEVFSLPYPPLGKLEDFAKELEQRLVRAHDLGGCVEEMITVPQQGVVFVIYYGEPDLNPELPKLEPSRLEPHLSALLNEYMSTPESRTAFGEPSQKVVSQLIRKHMRSLPVQALLHALTTLKNAEVEHSQTCRHDDCPLDKLYSYVEQELQTLIQHQTQ